MSALSLVRRNGRTSHSDFNLTSEALSENLGKPNILKTLETKRGQRPNGQEDDSQVRSLGIVLGDGGSGIGPLHLDELRG